MDATIGGVSSVKAYILEKIVPPLFLCHRNLYLLITIRKLFA